MINLDEVDNTLDERELSLKKKIFSLGKMEALVFSDPKLTTLYDDMAINGEERYGYHYNETIMNILFNDYILNSPKFLQKYKMAVPKKKKRRDKSEINKMKKNTEEKIKKSHELEEFPMNESLRDLWNDFLDSPIGVDDDANDPDYMGAKMDTQIPDDKLVSAIDKFKDKVAGRLTNPNSNNQSNSVVNTSQNTVTNMNTPENAVDETTSAGSAGGTAGYVGWSGPSAWSADGDLMGKKTKSLKPIEREMSPFNISVGENYLIESSFFENYVAKLDEMEGLDLYNELNKQYDATHTGSNDGMGVTATPQPKNRTKVIDIAQKHSGEGFSTQDMNNMTDKDINIIKRDAVERQTMFPHPENETLKDDGIAGNMDEKAVSKAQQRFMGMVHGVQKGTVDPKKVGSEVVDVAKTIKSKDAKDFASTKTNKLPEKIKNEDMNIEESSLIDVTDTTMAMKPVPLGVEFNGVERGVNSTPDAVSESIFTEIDEELRNLAELHSNLKKIAEDRKPSSLILKDRLGNDNKSNFKKDLQHSGTKEIIDVEKELEWKDQQTNVGDDPYKNGEDIEKEELKKTKGESFKNVGNSSNQKGNEIPKRNRTKEEQEEVDMYRKGLGDYAFSIEPDQKFEDRMKKDMGDKLYAQRQKKLDIRKNLPMYNKDRQPIINGHNMSETYITGKYYDSFGKSHISDFTLNECFEEDNVSDQWHELDLSGFGNKYSNKLDAETKKIGINEGISDIITKFDFYIDDDKNVIVVRAGNSLNESKSVDNPIVNAPENLDKMQHLLNYNTSEFVSMKNNKKI
jgi:hypothetical protein